VLINLKKIDKTLYIRYQHLHVSASRWHCQGFIKKRDFKYNMYLGASRTCPFDVVDSNRETQVNMRQYVTEGLDREIVVTIQKVLNVVEMSPRAGEFIQNQEVFKIRLVSLGS
jgi:hypothetical protein